MKSPPDLVVEARGGERLVGAGLGGHGLLHEAELLIVLAVVLLLFGGSQIPRLARNLGSARREFEAGMSNNDSETPNKT